MILCYIYIDECCGHPSSEKSRLIVDRNRYKICRCIILQKVGDFETVLNGMFSSIPFSCGPENPKEEGAEKLYSRGLRI